MPKPMKRPKPLGQRVHRVWVSDEDISAARKILTILEAADDGSPTSDDQSEGGMRADRSPTLRKVRQVLAFRDHRDATFNFSSETPFLLLMVLYYNEQWEPIVTVTRLTQLARISNSTVLRGIDLLLGEGLIDRTEDVTDLRKTLLSVSTKGRRLLEQFFADEPLVPDSTS